MAIRLDHHSGEPIWRQVVEQIKYQIASGELKHDEKLPSIRGLAGELAINPRTVVKAYESLEHLGLVVMRQGQGVFVSRGDYKTEVRSAARKKILNEMSRRLLAEGTRLGAQPEEMIEIIKQQIREMRDGRN
ncbi:MAG TPA: GntR family transcriptional regulator [Verrucomicrobiales bacterium]|nr:GntR family transcriptional regulator [Verrucomicrobiales bacterium]HIL68514.1 GntR family transcriptional regulator [Verrucomicrobiota bacterium]